MDFLKRCNGSTLCYFTKRCQRACFSALAYKGLLPESMMDLAYGSTSHTVRRMAPQIALRRSCATTLIQEQLKSKRELPQFVQQHLDRLQLEVTGALAGTVNDVILYGVHRPAGAVETPSNKISFELQEMAKYYFSQGGKLYRPTVALLMAASCSHDRMLEAVSENQYKIAVVSEMIHTASLVHDDVIDESDTRRNRPTVNALWGNKMAVLVGDYILAKATQLLCSIGNAQVVSIMAQIIEDLVKGEFMQMGVRDSSSEARFLHYMQKTYKKTASLFANSCKSVAVLAGCNENIQRTAFEYGKNLGMAFQLIDDLLDFVAQSATLGKPAGADLKLGLATAPVLFAAREYPELDRLILRRFSESNDVQKAWDFVLNSDGLRQTRQLARQHCEEAARLIAFLPNSAHFGEHLTDLAMSQLDREH
uniref:Decaprenyl diphosphate synthase subunit 1 n=1 Tax=Plectus sambesii TaxID=2011161 RepID=A0A914WFJ1_9BILA